MNNIVKIESLNDASPTLYRAVALLELLNQAALADDKIDSVRVSSVLSSALPLIKEGIRFTDKEACACKRSVN